MDSFIKFIFFLHRLQVIHVFIVFTLTAGEFETQVLFSQKKAENTKETLKQCQDPFSRCSGAFSHITQLHADLRTAPLKWASICVDEV